MQFLIHAYHIAVDVYILTIISISSRHEQIPQNTLRLEQKWLTFCRQHFHIHFVERIILCYLISASRVFVPKGYILELVNTGSGNGLVSSGSKPSPEPVLTEIHVP